MHRRTLLAGVTSGIVIPVTGCLGGLADLEDDTNTPPSEQAGEWSQFQADAAWSTTYEELQALVDQAQLL